ncbi:MAG: RNA polymerase ECF-type sigma factor, partial [uncultured Corynebacteriales bacterium]
DGSPAAAGRPRGGGRGADQGAVRRPRPGPARVRRPADRRPRRRRGRRAGDAGTGVAQPGRGDERARLGAGLAVHRRPEHRHRPGPGPGRPPAGGGRLRRRAGRRRRPGRPGGRLGGRDGRDGRAEPGAPLGHRGDLLPGPYRGGGGGGAGHPARDGEVPLLLRPAGAAGADRAEIDEAAGGGAM